MESNQTVITLAIVWMADGQDDPQSWAWHNLLDLGPYESAKVISAKTVARDFPFDKNGKPLAWPCPTQPDWYVDAWNGIYDSREFALRESLDWTAREADRVLDYGEDIVDEAEMAQRLGTFRTVYDNDGKTADRYTVVYDDGRMALALSDDCHMPNGVCMHVDCEHGEHLGSVVRFDSLPENVQRCILRDEASI